MNITPSVVVTSAFVPAVSWAGGRRRGWRRGGDLRGPVVCRIAAGALDHGAEGARDGGEVALVERELDPPALAGDERNRPRVVVDDALDVGLVEHGADDREGAPVARA